MADHTLTLTNIQEIVLGSYHRNIVDLFNSLIKSEMNRCGNRLFDELMDKNSRRYTKSEKIEMMRTSGLHVPTYAERYPDE